MSWSYIINNYFISTQRIMQLFCLFKELSTPRLGGTPDDNLLKEMAAISLKSSATAEAFSTNRQIEIIDVTANSELGNDNLHHVIDQHPMKHIEVIQLQDTPVPAKPPSLSSVITISSPEV